VVQQRPHAWQPSAEGHQAVACRFLKRGEHAIAFEVGPHDLRRPLVIDPTLRYSSYLGGGAADGGIDVAVDAAGAIYLTGRTESGDFPTRQPSQAGRTGGRDAFVLKLDPSGQALVYATYLGGGNHDFGAAIDVDGAGNAFVAGETQSSDFPTRSAAQPAFGGGRDAFIAKLDWQGALVWSTFHGGAGNESADSLAVDAAGSAYVAVSAPNAGAPTVNVDLRVVKLSAAGSIVYHADLDQQMFGLSLDEYPGGIAADPAGNAYVAGRSGSNELGIDTAVLVVRLDAGGNPAYVTRLGGTEKDEARGIALDAAGNVYVTGLVRSPDFPTAGPVQGHLLGLEDAFVTKLDPAGSIVYSTFLGGSDWDAANGIGVDDQGRAWVAGYSLSHDLPVVDALLGYSGGGDAFVSVLDQTGAALTFSTYLGGAGRDLAAGIALDSAGDALVTGVTDSTGFPVVSPFQPARRGDEDVFVARISLRD
jgi:hypothetical protein